MNLLRYDSAMSLTYVRRAADDGWRERARNPFKLLLTFERPPPASNMRYTPKPP